MFDWLKPKPPVRACIPDGKVVYAIGDLHGMAELTRLMIARLLADAKKFPGTKAHFIFLGDYVDKGDRSKEVINLLLKLKGRQDIDCTFIKGNHEDALLTFLENPIFGAQWVAYGGGQTLQSYGVSFPTGRTTPEAWLEVGERFATALPEEHKRFFESLPTSILIGGYFFVHAGIRPGRSLDNQEDGDLMWIRRQFLDDRRHLPAIVVHGHSPDLEPYRDHRRIGIDTGAYATGRLSAVRLLGNSVNILSVTKAGSEKH